MRVTELVFKLLAHKAKMGLFLTGYTVAMGSLLSQKDGNTMFTSDWPATVYSSSTDL